MTERFDNVDGFGRGQEVNLLTGQRAEHRSLDDMMTQLKVQDQTQSLS